MSSAGDNRVSRRPRRRSFGSLVLGVVDDALRDVAQFAVGPLRGGAEHLECPVFGAAVRGHEDAHGLVDHGAGGRLRSEVLTLLLALFDRSARWSCEWRRRVVHGGLHGVWAECLTPWFPLAERAKRPRLHRGSPTGPRPTESGASRARGRLLHPVRPSTW